MGLFDWLGGFFGVKSASTSMSGSALGDHDHRFELLEPAFNVDGTPMMGSVDINGNPYGVTKGMFEPMVGVHDSDGIPDIIAMNFLEPTVNIDGTPMVGAVDINGNAYGVTDSFSAHDSFGGHDSFGSGSFGSDW